LEGPRGGGGKRGGKASGEKGKKNEHDVGTGKRGGIKKSWKNEKISGKRRGSLVSHWDYSVQEGEGH